MRRILVSAFALGAAFGVLASNFVPVSAPEIAGEFNSVRQSPSGAARLSEVPVSTHAVPVRAEQVAPAVPSLDSFAAHVASPDAAARNRSANPASFHASFVQTESFSPATAFIKPRTLVAPQPVALLDVLSFANEAHTSVTGPDEALNDRLAAVPDRVTTSGRNPELSAEKSTPMTTVAAVPFEELPTLPAGPSFLANTHGSHGTEFVSSYSFDRISLSPEVPSRIEPIAFVKAAYQQPVAIFYRARFVVEPYAPIAASSLPFSEDEHAAILDQRADISPRALTEADAPVRGTPANTVSASPEELGAIFDRQRIVPELQKLVTSDVLATVNTHGAEQISTSGSNAIGMASPDTPGLPFVRSMIASVTELPSAVFQRMGLATLPEAPAVGQTLARNDAEISKGSSWAEAARTVVEKKEPILISATTTMSKNMLKPMTAGPLVDAPLPNENAIASTGYNSTPFDRMIVSPDVPEAITKTRPVLISAKPEFSADLLKPMNAVSSNPFVSLSKDEILAAAQQRQGYCDPNFVGPPIRFSQTVQLKLEDLINQLHQRFGVNFILGPNVGELPLNVKAGNIPWNVLLRSQLFVSGVRARCVDENTIELVENATLPSLQDMADVETRFVKLKFLQRTGSGTVDLANRSQGGQSGNQGGGCGGNNQGGTSGSIQSGGGGGNQGQQGQTVGQQVNNKFDKLIIEIEKILGLRSMQESSVGSQGGQGGGGTQQQTREAVRSNRFVTQIPGRNILAIRATKEEHELIDQIIARADRPPFQVVIKGLVYTANQDKLRDIGVQTTITGGTADGRSTSGIFGDTLGIGTLFDFSTVIGTFDFNVQATAFQQNGVISVKSRPFATVIDGLCTTLDVGRQLPIVIDSTLGGQGDVVFVNAANNLAVTPYVIDDENGNPIAVTLELRLTANDIDSSVTARGVPAISARSIQTQLLLDENKTAILGGFTVDSDSKTVQKTPGLGDIPIIGELFKRRIRDTRVNRLYFAVSVDIIPYPEAIRPVDVPGATTDPPSITPEQKKRADSAEPKQVKGP